MGSMMKELLVVITIVIAMVCDGLHIQIEEVDYHKDTILAKCAIEVDGHQRPLIDPSLCENNFMDPVCAYLYPISGAELQENPDGDDYYVSSRCYEGPLKIPASDCARKCANCCETPKFNCSNNRNVHDCVLIAKKGLCEKPGMEDFVSYFCSGQCGHCQRKPFNKLRCEDKYEECRKLFGIVPCTVPYMHKHCKGTCFVTDDYECHSVLLPPPVNEVRFVLPGFDPALTGFGQRRSWVGLSAGGLAHPYPSLGRLDCDPIDTDQ